MTVRTAALAAACLSGLLFAQDSAVPGGARTERLDFPASGVLHLKRPMGEVVIEGWDESGMEITITKAPPLLYDPQRREIQGRAGELDRVRVTTERQGNEVVVATAGPGRRVFPPRAAAAGILVTYRIRIPRNAALIADDAEGEVHVTDLAGDIHVTAGKGEITLRLPADGQYALDARSRAGDVIADYPGRELRRFWLVGHRFSPEEAPGGHKVYLRIGYGDILISQARNARLPAPAERPAAASPGQPAAK
jgi:hypothetical protein